MKAIAIRSFVSKQDVGCSERSRLNICVCKVYFVKLMDYGEYYIWHGNEEQHHFRENLCDFTYLKKEEFEENFKVIEK